MKKGSKAMGNGKRVSGVGAEGRPSASMWGIETALLCSGRGGRTDRGRRGDAETVSDTVSQRAAGVLKSEIWAALEPLLREIGHLTARLEQYAGLLAQVTEHRYPAVQVPRAVPGVGR